MNKINKITDESSDKKYFTITPRLVWALSRSPYDYTLWCTIKEIAGEKGECILSTEELATLSMMSAGKVSQSRKYLLDMGLLNGEVRRDPGFPQPVWHLTIPDIWDQNVEWAGEYATIQDRITFKNEQKKSLHHMKPSPHEGKPSPHEGKPSPHEGKPSPGETKKNHKEDPVKKNQLKEREAAPDFSNKDEFTKNIQLPEIQLYRKITGRIPGMPQMPIIYETIREHHFTEEDLKPYWREWVTRNYNVGHLAWLTEWAVNKEIPKQGPKKPEKKDRKRYTEGKYAEHINQ